MSGDYPHLHPTARAWVAVTAVVAMEDVGDRAAHPGILVRQLATQAVIEVRAARKLESTEQVCQRIVASEGINRLSLLPARQSEGIDALAFFYQFIGLLQNVMFQAKFAHACFELRQFP